MSIGISIGIVFNSIVIQFTVCSMLQFRGKVMELMELLLLLLLKYIDYSDIVTRMLRYFTQS